MTSRSLPDLNPEWVEKVAGQLAPVFWFLRHYWNHSHGDFLPMPQDIACLIVSLWDDYRQGQPEVTSMGSGGLVVYADEDEPVVAYVREIEFRYSDEK